MNDFSQADPEAKAPELPDIHAAWLESKKKRIKQYPQNILRASSAGNPCDRFHFYSIKCWREKELHNEILQSIFDEGALHEKDMMRQLVSEMGFEVVEQQRSFQHTKPPISGHIDGILRYKDHDFPFDIKSISAHDWQKIEAVEDLLYSKKLHQRNYPAQLQLYLLMSGNPVGCLIFKNKITGEPKTIWSQIDYDYCEQILRRAERVYAALQMDEPPERIKDFEACKDCAFRHVCLPDLAFGPGVIPIDDVELSGMLARRADLEPAAKEFKKIDEEVKEAVTQGGAGEKVCGDFLIRVSEHERKTKVPITWSDEVTTYLRAQFISIKKSGATK